jgi:hypothetical protein
MKACRRRRTIFSAAAECGTVGIISPANHEEIVIKAGGNEYKFPGSPYLTSRVYDILRQCGVELGKRDFLGAREPPH